MTLGCDRFLDRLTHACIVDLTAARRRDIGAGAGALPAGGGGRLHRERRRRDAPAALNDDFVLIALSLDRVVAGDGTEDTTSPYPELVDFAGRQCAGAFGPGQRQCVPRTVWGANF